MRWQSLGEGQTSSAQSVPTDCTAHLSLLPGTCQGAVLGTGGTIPPYPALPLSLPAGQPSFVHLAIPGQAEAPSTAGRLSLQHPCPPGCCRASGPQLCHPPPGPAEWVTKATSASRTQTRRTMEKSLPCPISLAILNPLHAACLLWLLGWSGAFLLSSRWSTAITPRLSSANGERLPSFIFLCNGKCKSKISVCEPFSGKTNIFIGTGQPANQAQNCWLLFLP